MGKPKGNSGDSPSIGARKHEAWDLAWQKYWNDFRSGSRTLLLEDSFQISSH